MMRRSKATSTPPVFADLALEIGGQWTTIDVERSGWLKDYGAALKQAERVGLILRGKKAPTLWLTINGNPPEYFSRVLGRISMDGDKMQGAVRVAGLRCGEVQAWLHRDGLVEIGPEPTHREV